MVASKLNHCIVLSRRDCKTWDGLTGKAGAVYGHSTMVVDIAWSPDGEKLATACRDGLVTIWPKRKLATHRNSIQITQAPLTCIAWSPDGRAIAVSGVGEFWLHDIQTGNRRHVALGMTVDDGFRFNRYRLANAQMSYFDQYPHHRIMISALKWAPTGNLLAAACGGKLFLLDKDGSVSTPFESAEAISDLACRPMAEPLPCARGRDDSDF